MRALMKLRGLLNYIPDWFGIADPATDSRARIESILLAMSPLMIATVGFARWVELGGVA